VPVSLFFPRLFTRRKLFPFVTFSTPFPPPAFCRLQLLRMHGPAAAPIRLRCPQLPVPLFPSLGGRALGYTSGLSGFTDYFEDSLGVYLLWDSPVSSLFSAIFRCGSPLTPSCAGVPQTRRVWEAHRVPSCFTPRCRRLFGFLSGWRFVRLQCLERRKAVFLSL